MLEPIVFDFRRAVKMVSRPSKDLVLAVICVVLCIVALLKVESKNSKEDLRDIKRLRRRLGMYACAVICWPAVVAMVIGLSSLHAPITAGVVVFVTLFLSFEVSVTSCYDGSFTEYDSTDSAYERSVQVTTVAFAVATLLLSQHSTTLANMVSIPVFASLLLCTGAAVPSAVSRRRVGASGYWVALQKVIVSYAAALLCIALARCLDEINGNTHYTFTS